MGKKNSCIYMCKSLAVVILLLFLFNINCTASTQSKGDDKGKQSATKDQTESGDCQRGEPEPVLMKSSFKRLAQFKAKETYRLDKITSLTIDHFGCHQFVERYRFDVHQKMKKVDDWKFWMALAASKIKELPAQSVTRAQLDGIALSLMTYVESGTPYVYKTPIVLSEMETLKFSVETNNNNQINMVILYTVAL